MFMGTSKFFVLWVAIGVVTIGFPHENMILEVPIWRTFKVQLQGQREMVSSFFLDLELFDHPVFYVSDNIF